MPKGNKAPPLDLSDLNSQHLPDMTFGEYMRSVRKAQRIPLRVLAKKVNKTPTYISDIENGNNRPPDKALLDAILSALNVSSVPQIREKLYDLAAVGRNDVPADIKEYMFQNPETISFLRALQIAQNGKELLAEIASQYCKGGANNDSE